MIYHRYMMLYLLALLVSVSMMACTPKDTGTSNDMTADYVLTNGKIYTVNPDQPWAEAVAVRGNTIIYVGDDAGAQSYISGNAKHVDLQGDMVLPGFVESHIHVAMGGATTSGVILEMGDSIDDVLQKVKEYAEANPDKKTIFGASYNAFLFDEKGPSKELLDKVVPDRPVYLMDHTLHSVWVNSKAFEVAGITRDTPNPEGGEYVHNDNGELRGSVKGGPAHMPILVATEAITAESIGEALPDVVEGLSEFGFTSVMDLGAPIATEASFQAVVDMDTKGELPIRVSLTHYINTPSLAANSQKMLREYSVKYMSDHVWMDTLKITIDSVLENQKAAMMEPYLSTKDSGVLMFDEAEISRMVTEVADEDFNVIIHAIGDRAVKTAVDVYEAMRAMGYDKAILSVTHTQMVRLEDRDRFAEHDIVVQSTGNWAIPNPTYIEHLGQERYETLQFPFKAWEDSGAVVSLGSDWPATPGGFEVGVNPFINMQSAMFRRAPRVHQEPLGSIDETLSPEAQVLTLEQAIAGYTINGAIQLGIDDKVGSIEVGKLADMILLDQNLFEIPAEDIHKTKVLATMMDGVIRHDVVHGLGDSELVDLDELDIELHGLCGPTHEHN